MANPTQFQVPNPIYDLMCVSKRMDIINFGKKLSDDGAHYLWGTEGQTPNSGGSVKFAPVVLDTKPGSNIAFCAASHGGDICVGRFRHPGLKGIPQGKDRIDSGSSAALKQFVSDYSGKVNLQINWDDRLTPRRVVGYTNGGSPTDYSGGKVDLVGKIVWGEGCDATQHFDCGGFVRYVVENVCGVSIKGISGTTNEWQPKNKYNHPMGRVLKDGESIFPGDILCYGTHHIAFNISNGTYQRGAAYKILQAEDAVSGLNYDNPPRGGDTKCIRLSVSTLLNIDTDYVEMISNSPLMTRSH